MNSSLKVAELGEKLSVLVNETYKLLETTNNPEIRENLVKELDLLKNREDLRIAFVGQYSSGKSTIISALTGRKDIKIDANVATDKVSEYRWNNIVLLDTPGILAGKSENHDEATKEALRKTDLIVYVLTSQLFDDVVFENFIDLAYNQHFKDKMLIAINKMSMEAGDFDTLVSNYTTSIKTIFKERGYDFDFEIVFFDAVDFIEGKEENDEEFIRLSNFSNFINKLNSFVESKGIIKKQFDTPVRLLKSTISDISIAQIDPNLQTILSQYERRIRKSKSTLQNKVSLALSKCEQKIIQLGQPLGDMIGESTQEEYATKEKEFEVLVQENIQNISDEIEAVINEEESELFREIEILDKKEIINIYRSQLDTKLSGNNISNEERMSFEKQKTYLNMFKQGSDFLVRNSLNTVGQTSLKTTVSMASGSNMRNVVYEAGKFFGKKFRPWEATRMAGNIGKYAKGFGAALGILSVGLEVYNVYKEDKKIKELQEAKSKAYSSVRAYASNIIQQLSKEFNIYIADSYDTKLLEMESQKTEIINEESKNKQFSELIGKLDAEYVDFIELVEKS